MNKSIIKNHNSLGCETSDDEEGNIGTYRRRRRRKKAEGEGEGKREGEGEGEGEGG